MLPVMVLANAGTGDQVQGWCLYLAEFAIIAGTKTAASSGRSEALNRKIFTVFVALGNQKARQVACSVLLLKPAPLAVCLAGRGSKRVRYERAYQNKT